ncbi:MAG: hypothetical protein V4527_06815 [Pseudomonadota bacterium]
MSVQGSAEKVGDIRQLPRLKGRKPRTLPPAGSPVISGLERKYQETLGSLKKLQEQEFDWEGFAGYEEATANFYLRLRELEKTLVCLEGSIRQFDPNWVYGRKRHMEPKVKRSSPMLPKNSFKPALISVLRRAAQPLTVKEIADESAKELGLPMNSRGERQRVWGLTYNALRASLDQGYVVCFEGSPARWSARPNSHSDGRREPRFGS